MNKGKVMTAILTGCTYLRTPFLEVEYLTTEGVGSLKYLVA
jgi:hypothetical protein